MTFEKAKEWAGIVSATVIAMSAVHVIAASIYLYFYCVGFGAKLSMFYSAPDIFSISITKLANVYVRSLLWPALVFGLFYFFRVKNNAEWIASAPTPERAARRQRGNETTVFILLWGFWLLVAGTSAPVIWKLYHGEQASVFAVLSTLALAILMTVVRRFGHAPPPVWLGMFFLSGVIGGAADNGQMDRHTSYASSRSLPTCGGFRLMGKASGLYLAIGNQGTKVLLKDDCAVAFVFPRPVIRR